MLIILDCCREYGNAIPKKNFLTDQATNTLREGPAAMHGLPATIISYACAADQISSGL